EGDTPSGDVHARVRPCERLRRAGGDHRCGALQIRSAIQPGACRTSTPGGRPCGISLAACRRMDTFLDEPTARFVSRYGEGDIDELPPTDTKARPLAGWRQAALAA